MISEQDLIRALTMLRLAHLSEYGAAPKTPEEVLLQARVYAAALNLAKCKRECLEPAVARLVTTEHQFPSPSRLIEALQDKAERLYVRIGLEAQPSPQLAEQGYTECIEVVEVPRAMPECEVERLVAASRLPPALPRGDQTDARRRVAEILASPEPPRGRTRRQREEPPMIEVDEAQVAERKRQVAALKAAGQKAAPT